MPRRPGDPERAPADGSTVAVAALVIGALVVLAAVRRTFPVVRF